MSASVAASPAPKSAPTPKPASTPSPSTASTSSTTSATSSPSATPSASGTPTSTAGDSVNLSSEAGSTEKPKEENAYEGIADKTSTVTVDPYKQGKNDTIEGILRNQGYSLQDIYNKGADGKTLIDHVAEVNNLKNPNVIQDGASLKVPGRENSESLSSMDLDNGQEQSSEVKNNEKGVGTESTMKKNEDGSSELDVKTNNQQNPDAELSTNTKVEDGGRIDSNSTATDKGVETNTVAQNKDGSAVTQVKETATPESTDVSIKDIDRKGDNMSVKADENGLTAVNPGSENAGDVTTKVDYSEASSDGAVENFTRWVAEGLGFQGETPAPVSAENVGEVRVSKNDEGQATVSTVDGGKETELLTTAGDTDDTWFEKGGELVDNGIAAVGQGFSDAWTGISNWWNGTETPAAETSKTPVGNSN